MMPDCNQTVNAALIGCTAWLERPALIINKIKAFWGLKITANTSCNPKRLGYSLDMKTNKSNKQTVKILGQVVTVGSKKHAILAAQLRQFNGTPRNEQ